MRKILRGGFMVLAVGFVILQFFRPDRTNPPVVPARALESHFAVPPNITVTLRRSCFDCHSNETHWPWYTNVSPISWVIASHINGGRSHLNFDEWDRLKGSHEQAVGFRLICREIKGHDMPLPSYLWIHWNSSLSESDISEVCAWTTAMQQSLGEPDTTPAK